ACLVPAGGAGVAAGVDGAAVDALDWRAVGDGDGGDVDDGNIVYQAVGDDGADDGGELPVGEAVGAGGGELLDELVVDGGGVAVVDVGDEVLHGGELDGVGHFGLLTVTDGFQFR